MKIKLVSYSLRLILLIVTTIVISQATKVSAAAFYNYTYTDVGRAFAGNVAGGYDASTVYANPAGMMLLDCYEVKGGIDFVFPRIDIEGSSFTLPEGVSNVAGSNPRDKTVFAPNIYAVYPFDWITIGLGFASPYGIDLDYDNGWAGRFHRISSRIQTYDILPAVAIDATDWLSLGVGLDIQNAHLDLTKAKSVSNALTTAVVGQTIAQLTNNGVPLPEFRTQFKSDSWAVGVNAGAIVKVNENLKLGLDFLSTTSHDFKGDFITTSVPVANAISNSIGTALAAGSTLPAQAKLRLPNILTFGGSWDVNPYWNIGAQIQWFNWSRFNNLQVTGQSGGVLLDQIPEQFKDTVSISIGTEIQALENLLFQFGFMYDQSPIQNSTRSPAIPDSDRYWLSGGVTLIYMPGFSATAGYAHVFTDNGPINLTENAAIAANVSGSGISGIGNVASGANVIGTNNSTIVGSANSPIDIVSISLRFEF